MCFDATAVKKKTTRFFCISHGNNVDVMSIKTQLSVSGGWTRLKMHNARCTQLRSKFRAVSTKLPKKCSLYKSCYTSNTVLQRYFPNGCVNAIMWTSDLGQKKILLRDLHFVRSVGMVLQLCKVISGPLEALLILE